MRQDTIGQDTMGQDTIRRGVPMKDGEASLIPFGLRRFLVRRLYEIAGLIILSLCFTLVLSLSGWSASDPSFSHAVDRVPENYLGYWGAMVADLAMQILGLGSIGLLIPPLIWGIYLLSHGFPYRFWLRGLCWIVGILLCAGAFSSIDPPSNWPLTIGLGGIVGDWVSSLAYDFYRLFFSGLGDFIFVALFFLMTVFFILCAGGLSAVRHEETMNMLSPTAAGERERRGLRFRFVTAVSRLSGFYVGFRVRISAIRDMCRHWHDRIFFSDREGGFFSFLSFRGIGALGRILWKPHRSVPADEETDAYDSDGRIEPYLTVSEMEENTRRHGWGSATLSNINGDGGAVSDRDDASLYAPALHAPSITPRSAPLRQVTRPSDPASFSLPSLSLLSLPRVRRHGEDISAAVLQEKAHQLRTVLEDFGIQGDIINVRPGPVVTLYELEPAPGVKSSRVINLADDIARSMSALSTRVAVIPGRNVIGIELPNAHREMVYLRELLGAEHYAHACADLTLALGKTIGGEPVFADLARMPHLLIAGTTGSGKSVGINTMILSLLYRLTADRCKLIMIDPKMLELSVYEGIPHLLTPVVTDPKKAVAALKWTVREMERRYHEMSRFGVRNIDGFNHRIMQARANGEDMGYDVQTGYEGADEMSRHVPEAPRLEPLPYIVVMVDEMADLMMVAGKEIEGALQRLAQMARAAGIHLITATQRPSVDVITGTIKANLPTRISFQVTTKVDSRTILGEQGAEQLLGQGDMLYMVGGGRITRLHGAFVSDDEVEKVVRFLRKQGRPDYLDSVISGSDAAAHDAERIGEDMGGVFDSSPLGYDIGSGADMGLHAALEGENVGDGGGGIDEKLYRQACEIVVRDRKASTSYLQRRLQIGYNRAASLIERLEDNGIVSMANHAGKREVLIGKDS